MLPVGSTDTQWLGWQVWMTDSTEERSRSPAKASVNGEMTLEGGAVVDGDAGQVRDDDSWCRQIARARIGHREPGDRSAGYVRTSPWPGSCTAPLSRRSELSCSRSRSR